MEIKLAFGVRNGKLIHISDISPKQNGLKCDCICPKCKHTLIAKAYGTKRIPHFAHANNSNCNIQNANETGLHLFAKQIIEDHSSILFPSWTISKYDVMNDDYSPKIAKELNIEKPIIQQACIYDYMSAFSEKQMDSIKPDIILLVKNKKCAVEIAVTHFVNAQKKEKVVAMGLPMFQIDLSKISRDTSNKDAIINAVLFSENREWIYNPKRESKLKELQIAYKQKKKKLIPPSPERLSIQNSLKKRKLGFLQDNKKQDSMLLYNQAKKTTSTSEKPTKSSNDQDDFSALRNDIQAKELLRKLSFNKELTDYPFFMDIPINDECVISCDRRIWQGSLFEKFVYNNNQFSLRQIREYIEKNLPLNRNKMYKNISDNDEENVLYNVIKEYFSYLSYLGFIHWNGQIGKTAQPHSLIPPKEGFAFILQKKLESSSVVFRTRH